MELEFFGKIVPGSGAARGETEEPAQPGKPVHGETRAAAMILETALT